MSILITRPSPAGKQLLNRLRARGKSAWHLPLIDFTPGNDLPHLPQRLGELSSGDLLFVVSQHAINYAHPLLTKQAVSWPVGLHYYGVGRSTALLLHGLSGLPVSYSDQGETSEDLLNLPGLERIDGKRALILRGNGGREVLEQTLRQRGVQTTYCECYRRIRIHYDGEEQGRRMQTLGIDTLVNMAQHTTPTIPQDDATKKANSPHVSTPLSGDANPRPAPLSPSPGGKTPPASNGKTAAGRRSLALILAALVLVIAVLVAIDVYISARLVGHQQEAAHTQLQASLDELNHAQQTQRQQYQDSLAAQRQTIEAARAKQEAQGHQLENLQKKLTAITGSNANTWLLSQADFLVKMAGRKLWSDQDVVTASTLLKSADASLAQMNDPTLIEARRAIREDISTLTGFSLIDFDGIILKLNQLTNHVDNLRLADNDSDKSSMDSDRGELSGSIQEWRQNLNKSWHNFIKDFITVHHRNTGGEPLLAPNQDVYLRENIRARLLVAAQAVPRHQNETYQQSLDSVSTWVRAYFDANDATTRAFVSQLDALGQEDISMHLPDSLKSQPLLDKLMQSRVRNLLAQSNRANKL